MLKDTSRDRGKDVSLFEKGQIIGMHQAEKISKKIAETTKNGLRTVQRIIKNWRDSWGVYCESKSISTQTMQRKLKGLGLNSCVAFN